MVDRRNNIKTIHGTSRKNCGPKGCKDDFLVYAILPDVIPFVKGGPISSVKTALCVEGTEATYRMTPDDLYVRAKIESSVSSGFERHFHPDVLAAWTQPHRG